MSDSTNDKQDPKSGSQDRIKDSAQQIWLAGLGAFARMQQEGSKAFEALVKDGTGVQKKTQEAAGETFAQAQARMAGLASEFGSRAAGGWGKLETLFEQRVAQALDKLGMPSAREVAALQARVEALEAQLAATTGKAGKAAAGPRAPRKPAARKSPSAAVKPSRRNKPGTD